MFGLRDQVHVKHGQVAGIAQAGQVVVRGGHAVVAGPAQLFLFRWIPRVEPTGGVLGNWRQRLFLFANIKRNNELWEQIKTYKIVCFDFVKN